MLFLDGAYTFDDEAPMGWMQRLKRVFHIDIEHWGVCGGTLRVIACSVVSRILSWDHPGNWSDCSVDGLLGKTEQSGSRPESSPSPFS